MKKLCPQYYFMLGVMIERSSMQPKATNMHLDSSESEDNIRDDNEEDKDGEVAIIATTNRAVGAPHRSRHGSDISALGVSGRKRRAASVSESFFETNQALDSNLATYTQTRSKYYKNMAEKIGTESAVLEVRKGAEAAKAAADVLTAEAAGARAAAELAASKTQLFDTCMVFVKMYDGAATKEEILQLFPIYADFIDMVLWLQHTSGA
jgi:hypothetical protein